MSIAEQHADIHGVQPTCEALGISRATYYRRKRQPADPPESKRFPPRKLSDEEEQAVLSELNSERFMDMGVPSVYTTLLDEGRYTCSQRSMYRILHRNQQVRDRRHDRTHPIYQKPELLATGPNQVWSWDITRIKGPKPWIFYHLYVVIDVFSRYVVAWTISDHESGEQARALIEAACQRQGVTGEGLTIHSDRGKAMRSKNLADLLGELGVKRSFSRPHVSNDNPYSESQFKTLKYHASYPERFGSLEDARGHMRAFFKWYNTEHRHSGIAMMTPETVHVGRTEHVLKQRKQTLQKAYQRNPERFVNGEPQPRQVPDQVWINQPKLSAA
jgi:putative transposase